MPCGSKPRAKDFPRRNRLISGISIGVLVVEAATRSGTLVTARYAAEQGREVFAIPGHPLDPRAAGTNALLKEGANLTTHPDDILNVLRPIAGADIRAFREPQPRELEPAPRTPQPPSIPVTSDASATDTVRTALGPAPIDIDTIHRATGMRANEVRIALLELELAGEIERHGANLVSLRSPSTPPE